MPTHPRLSATQSKILTHALGQTRRAVLPLPPDCRLVGGARQAVLLALQRHGLIEPIGGAAGKGALRISAAGMAAIGASPLEAAADTPRPGGKLGLLLDMLATPDGAGIVALAERTGWLPHTIRAALSRLRQRGYAVQLLPIDGEKRYRMTEAGHVEA